MNILKIMAMLLVVVAVVSAAGCTEKAQVAGNESQEASEQVRTTAAPTASVVKSVPSITPSAKNNTDLTSSTVVDVVCKMKIDKRTAELTSKYKGKTYYFCALSCKKEFDENPEKYINSETVENNSETTENETQEASVTSATNNSTDLTSSTVVDVVCKMEIDKNTAEFTSEYKGTTYYFCALSCKNEFDENPEKYIGSETAEDNSDATENESQETSEQITSTNNSTDSMSSTVVDVVCKMEIDKDAAEFTSEYEGTIYYFCSASCKKEFDENPEKYINSETIENDSNITENKTQKNCKAIEIKTQKNCKTIEIKAQKNCKNTENKNQAASKSC